MMYNFILPKSILHNTANSQFPLSANPCRWGFQELNKILFERHVVDQIWAHNQNVRFEQRNSFWQHLSGLNSIGCQPVHILSSFKILWTPGISFFLYERQETNKWVIESKVDYSWKCTIKKKTSSNLTNLWHEINCNVKQVHQYTYKPLLGV